MTSINQKLFERKTDYENILAKVVKSIEVGGSGLNQRELELISYALQDCIDNIDKTLRQIGYEK